MSKEYIHINPIEELLKGIAIVHGQTYADNVRNTMAHMTGPVNINLTGPGTPHGRLTALAEWVENTFIHNRYDSQGFETTLIRGVTELQEEVLAAHETETKLRETLGRFEEEDLVEAVRKVVHQNWLYRTEISRLKRRKR